MKTNYLIYILLVGIFLVSAFQVFNVLYSVDNEFNSQIENQLISVVQIKGERINDYFLERGNDAIFISGTDEVSELFSRGGSYDSIVEENMKFKLEIIFKQIEISERGNRNDYINDCRQYEKEYENVTNTCACKRRNHHLL